jgi:putative ABC transport system permease protein
MFRNYFKIAIRNLLKQKGYTFINIFGLAVGICACVLIAAYVQSELSYDKHHAYVDRIYRINTEFDFPDQNDKTARNSLPFAPHFAADFPEVEDYLRLFQLQKQTLRYEDKIFNETDLCFADSSLFNFFSYEVIAGNKKNALNVPGTIVITEEKAKKYFGGANEAIDKLLTFPNSTYRVTAVIKDPVQETHIPYKFFLSLSSVPKPIVDQAMQDYMWMLTFTYLKVNKGVTKETLEQKLNAFHDKRIEPWLKENNVQGTIKYSAQALPSIHLSSDRNYDYAGNSNPLYISIFTVAGIFILLIACFNYLNLVTARSIRRSKEVGLRKVMGAGRGQLVLQFLGESSIVTVIAFALAYVLISLFLNEFNQLTGKNFAESDFFNLKLLLPLTLLFLFISIIAGSYPAFYLSRFQPVQALKMGAVNIADKKSSFLLEALSPINIRKGLVVLQFAISIILISGFLIIYSQFDYLKNKDLGFSKDQIVVVDIPADTALAANLQTIKNELLKNPDIRQAASSSHIPGELTGMLYFNVEQQGQTEDKMLNYIFVDDDYLKMLNIPVTQGRNFSKEIASDPNEAFIINETAAKFLNWKEPLDKKMQNGLGINGKVVGVVKDYNYASLHNPISPLVIMYTPKTTGFLLVKISGKNMKETINYIQSKWSAFDPQHPMEYYFLDENFDKIYRKEENMFAIFGYFASLAIIISCMGLIALASFTAEQKTKEIGIRKVLGASVPGIAVSLSKNFLLLVLLANIIAIPASIYGMNKWLQNFAYRIELSVWLFIASALLAFIIALLSVAYQAVKAATANPVKSLRYE